MKRYTFITEFRGGTYISQHVEKDIYDAAKIWVATLDTSIFPQRIIDKLQKKIIEEEPTPITGVKNVWCSTFSPYNYFLLLNIIETV